MIAAVGPDARAATDALTAALRDDFPRARLDAAAALAEIGTNLPQALPVVSRMLADEDVYNRRFAATVLGRFGAAARTALPRLTVALGDGDSEMRQDVVASFRTIIDAIVDGRRTDAFKNLRSAAKAMERYSDQEARNLGLDLSEAADALEAMKASSGK